METAEDGLRDLGDQCLLLIVARRAGELGGRVVDDLNAGLFGQQDDAHEQADGNCSEQQQRRCCIARLGFLKRRHPVADRLDTGQRRTPRGERPRHQKRQRKAGDGATFGVHREPGGFGAQRIAQHVDPEQAPAEHETHPDDECVGRNGKGHTGFANSAQVQCRYQQDRAEAEQHLVVGHERDRRPDVRHRRCRRNRNCENVVHHQGAGHGQTGVGTEVGGDHFVIAAAGRVGVHVLPVACHHDQHHRRHGDADPGRQRIRRQARHREHQEDLFRGVRNRGERIGGEHRQGDPLGQQRVAQPVAAERLTQDESPRRSRKFGHESQE